MCLFVCLLSRVHWADETSHEAELIYTCNPKILDDLFPHGVGLHRNSGLVRAFLHCLFSDYDSGTASRASILEGVLGGVVKCLSCL